MFLDKNAKWKKFLLAMIACMLAVMLALASACGNDSSDDDEDEEEETTVAATDYQTLTNGDFEYDTDEDSSYPYSSPSGWSKSLDSDVSSSASSLATSGIIDTSDDAWTDLTSSDNGKSKLTTNPGTPYSYKLITDDFVKENGYVEDDEDKQSNPNYTGTKVLFIGNNTSAKTGTAQYYKSSKSLTVAMGGYAKLSLWIKTTDLSNAYDTDTGAYISFESSISTESFKTYTIDNIDTNGMWAYVEFYIEGCDFASVTISSLKIGLGHGNGLNASRYVEGNLFIDNVRYDTYDSYADYTEAVKEASFTETTNMSFEEAATIECPEKDTFKDNSAAQYTTLTYNVVYINLHDAVYNRVDDENLVISDPTYNFVYTGKDADHSENTAKVTTFGNLDASIAKGISLDSTSKVVEMKFVTPDSAKFTSEKIKVKANYYTSIMFYTQVKTEKVSSTGATVSILEENGTTTSVISSVEELEEEGKYGLWTYYTILVYNDSDKDTEVSLVFQLGVDDGTISNLADASVDLTEGYAYLAGVRERGIGEEDNEIIPEGDYIYKVTTHGSYTVYEEEEDDTSTDSYTMSIGAGQKATLKNSVVENSNGYYFGGDETKTIHGVINSKYVDNYDGIDTTTKTAIKALTDGDNKYVQALMLYNKEAASSSYLTSSYTFSANTFNYVKVTVKAIDATAKIYLVAYEDQTYSVLKLNDNSFVKTVTSAVKANDTDGDDWVDVYFYVATGDFDKTYRVEIYNGGRDSETSSGAVLINSITTGTLEEDAYNETYDNYIRDYSVFDPFVTDNAEFVSNSYVTFASYEEIDVEEEDEDEEDEDEDEEEEEEEEEDDASKEYDVDNNVFLEISSIVIAIILIIVIAAVVIRDAMKKKARKKAVIEENYKRDARDIALEKIAKKKAEQQKKEDKKIDVEEVDETTEEYNYDEAENVEETPTDSEIIDEVIEEVTEEKPAENDENPNS